MRSQLKRTYGINEINFLTNLKDFNIVKQLWQDIIHTLLKRNVQYNLENFIIKLLHVYFDRTK